MLPHESYPSYRALMDPKRHLLFGFGDIRELISLAIRAAMLLIIVIMFGSLLLLPLVLIIAYLQYQEIHSHAGDPWYYVIRRKSVEQRWTPERSAYVTTRADDRFRRDERLITANMSAWRRLRRWFSKTESFGPVYIERNAPAGDVHPSDLPLGGKRLFVLGAPSKFWGFHVPTGREIIMKLRRMPIVKRFRLDGIVNTFGVVALERHALPDALPWRSEPDNYTVRTKDEGYLRSWSVRGSATDTVELLAQVKQRMDTAIMSMGEACSIWGHIAIDRDDEAFPSKLYPVAAAALAAFERELQEKRKTRIRVRATIHLMYSPHRDKGNTLEGESEREISIKNYQRFVGIASQFEAMLKRAWPIIVPLGRDEDRDYQAESIALPLTFGGGEQPVPKAPANAYLSERLGRHTISLDVRRNGGEPTGYVRIDDRLVALQNLYDIERQTVEPDMLRMLEGQDPPVLLGFRWVAMERSEERKVITDAFNTAGKNTEHVGSGIGADGMPNLAAVDQQRESLGLDRQVELGHARVGYGTITIGMYEQIDDEGVEAARARLRNRVQNVNGALRQCKLNFANDPDNLIGSLFGIIPGNLVDNALANPIASGVIANLFSTYSPWLGNDKVRESEGNYLNRDGKPVDALFFATGTDRRRFAWSPQVGQRAGHALVIADSGSGKSTFLMKLVTEYLHYDVSLKHGARVVVIDRDGSNKIAAALNHAEFLVCGDGATVGLPVFADVMSEQGKETAMACLRAMLEAKRIPITRASEDEIGEMIRTLQMQENPDDLTMDTAAFASEISFETKAALERYTSEQAGKLFSETGDPFSGRFTYVDIAPAMSSAELRVPAVIALMAAIERSAMVNRSPMLLVAEEFWEMLRDERWSDIFIGWLKRMRKFGVWIWLVTHSVSDLDVLGSRAEQMKEQLRNVIVLPSNKFYSAEAKAKLMDIGITPDRIEALARASGVEGGTHVPVAEIIQDTNHRLVPIDLGSVGLAICGSTGESARKRFAEILQRNNGEIDRTLVDWIRERGGKNRQRWAEEAEDIVEQYSKQMSERGVPPRVYDPRLFDPEIGDVFVNSDFAIETLAS